MKRATSPTTIEARILVTEDKDFGDLAIRQGQGAVAVMLLRIEDARAPEKLARVLQVVDALGERLHGSFIVVGRAAHRVHALPAKHPQ